MDLASWIRRRRSAIAAGLALAALWGGLALLTWRRNAAWESRGALWEDAVEKSPRKARAHLSLGFARREAARYDEAIAEYTRALQHARGDIEMELQILRNLGAALIWTNRLDEAEVALRMALGKSPDEPEILDNLGIVMLGRNDLTRAEELARRTIAVAPGDGHAWNLLGVVLLQRGDLAGSRPALERAIALDPDVGERHYNLGRVLDRQGRTAEACAAWRQALLTRATAAVRAEVTRLAAARSCPR